MNHLFSRLAVPLCLGSVAWAQTTIRASVDSSGGQGDADSYRTAISADGRFVAFLSLADNLVPGDTNAQADIFVHDNQTGATERVSVATGGAQADGPSSKPSISGDGRYVAFWSQATNLAPGVNPDQIYVRDRQTGTTELVSVSTGGAPANSACYYYRASISADGRYVAFWSVADNLVPGDTNNTSDIFVRDRLAGTTERVSVDSAGVQANDYSTYLAISADGRFVAFSSDASNLVPGDTNGVADVFVHDRQTGTTERVSVDSAGNQGNRDSDWPTISSDGRFTAFESWATNLVPGATSIYSNVYVHDRQTGMTELVSRNLSGAEGDGESDEPSISADGRYVAFASNSTNMVQGYGNLATSIIVRDLQNGSNELASVSTGGVPGQPSFEASISADGRYVAFMTPATNVVPGDTNHHEDVFVHDLACTGGIADYCTAKTNSLGCIPSIGSAGVPSLSGPDNFFVTASNVRNRKLGMMLWSLASDDRPLFGGTLCVHATIQRTLGQDSGGSASGDDCTGTYSFHFTQAYMNQHALGAHTNVYAQYWSRDPGFAPPDNVGLTNGLQFTICP